MYNIFAGVLTGFLVCHCLFVVLFGPPYGSHYTLIARYAHFALPLHSAVYAALAICAVAAFDKSVIYSAYIEEFNRMGPLRESSLQKPV